MLHSQWRVGVTMAALLGAATMLVAACAGTGGQPSPDLRAGLSCVDDSPRCVSERGGALKALLADKKRDWVRERPTAAAYATGVRLFAFKTLRRELTCEQLAVGRGEAEAGPAVLRGSGGHGLTPAQISRGVMLAGEVSRELGRERSRRCRKGSG